MRSLILTVAVLLIAYLLQTRHPWWAGAVAVIPVKILATAAMTWETNPHALHTAIEGMLVWQCVWAVGLLGAWWWTR